MAFLGKINKYIFFIFLSSCFLLPHSSLAVTKRNLTPNDLLVKNTSAGYVPGEVIVKFKKNKLNITSNNLVTAIKKFSFPLMKGLRTKKEDRLDNTVVYKINSRSSVADVITMLKQNADVANVEPNYRYHFFSIGTNDPYDTNLWGLDNTGQTLTLGDSTTATGTANADIDIPEAWALSTGTTEVIVAVIDSGVAYKHPDLIGNMWDGTNCIGTDRDGNAITGGNCLHGYDFEDNDKDPLPTTSTHGTHVAGTIAATQNNSKGIVGVGPRIKIMAIKCDLSVSCLVSSINFARENGAKVINASWGGSDYSTPIYDAISNFQAAGGIFVAAAGNDGTDNDVTTHHYPSDYDLSNIIAVAATDQGDSLASFSDTGATSVDVGAPGVNIFSTFDESTIINETFNNVIAPNLPPGWTSDYVSNWGTYNIGTTAVPNNVLYGDLTYPYVSSVNSTIGYTTVDLSSYSNAKFDFTAKCDTEYTDPYGVGDSSSDYMALEISADGVNYTELKRWNSYSLDALNNYSGSPYVHEFDDLSIGSTYLTSNFQFRLRWVADGDSDRGSGDGCLVKNFKILSYTDGSDEKYAFEDGTSMAAPHVSGLAGYLWSIKPTATTDEIISNILNNGDTLPSLIGKTSTSRRINAYNSVLALGITTPPVTGPSITGLADDSTPARSKTWTWSSANPSTDTYRYLIDQSASSAPSGTYGTGNTASLSAGTGTYYLHVQAQDASNNAGTVTTVSCILDNTGLIPTLNSSTITGFVLNFGETAYDVGGSALANSQDITGFFTITPSFIGTSAVYNDSQITFVIPGAPAGSRVTLNIGNLFDSLGNGSTNVTTVFNGDSWQENPAILNIGTTFLPDLFVSGVFITTPSNLNTTENIIISVGDTSNSNTVNIPNNTNISELSDADFDASQIQLTSLDPGTVSNLGSDYVPESVVQWGIISTTLKFDNPIIINIFVGTTFNDQTLNIFRSPNLDSSWTTDGLGNSTCTVSSGYCQFTATKASYYVAAYSPSSVTPTPTAVPSSNNNSSNSTPIFTQIHDAPQCTATSPILTPDLFKIITTKGSAKIVFTPVIENITGYQIVYGFKKNDDRFGVMFHFVNNNQGEQNFTINQLNPKTTYYFKVSAVNGCTAGPWSDWIPAKANGKKTINKYKATLVNKKVVLVNLYK
jgi:subtilisin family serine protease